MMARAAVLAGLLLAGCAQPPEQQAKAAAYGSVRDLLKAPSSARFSRAFVSCNEANTVCFVSGDVEAENSYGAALRQRFIAKVERRPGGAFTEASANLF